MAVCQSRNIARTAYAAQQRSRRNLGTRHYVASPEQHGRWIAEMRVLEVPNPGSRENYLVSITRTRIRLDCDNRTVKCSDDWRADRCRDVNAFVRPSTGSRIPKSPAALPCTWVCRI